MPVVKKNIDHSLGIIPDNVVSSVLSLYGFSDKWSILPFISTNLNIIELNRKSETSRKLLVKYKQDLYFLKEMPWYCSNEKFVSYELKLQDYLRENGLPIPRIIKTLKGNLYSTYLEKYFVLQEFIMGDTWTKDATQTYNSGKTLGEFHKKSKHFLYSSSPKENIFDLSQSMINLSKNVLLEKGGLSDAENVSKYSRYYKGSIDLLKNIRQSAYEKGYSELVQHVHGDYNPFNLLFQNKNVSAILDFNNACEDNPVHDIAEGLVHYSYINYRPNTTYYESIPNKFNKRLFFTFLDGYIARNRNIFLKIKNYLKESIICIILELSALGIICGDYSFSEIEKLTMNHQKIVQDLESVLDKYYLHNPIIYD